MSPPVVTFDAGQTLVELDCEVLASRLAERGVVVGAAALDAALMGAWAIYDREVAAGVGHPWQALMAAVLDGAGIAPDAVGALVPWLWTEQRVRNLWRRPIAPMVELARELVARGVRVAVLSNSEGKLAELLAEVGIADAFEVIVDSGRVGVDKPDPRIFAHTLAALGGVDAEVVPVHVGDSWAADVVGARGVGWRAIWYGPRVGEVRDGDAGVAIARDADEVRAALRAWGVI